MFSNEERNLISYLLELFAQSSQIPIAVYEQDSSGNVSEIASAHGEMFPPHCQGLWALDGGQTKCWQNMRERAKQGFQSGEHTDYLCHAGLTTETHPLVINGAVKAVLQYGAYRKSEEREQDQKARLRRHEQAMQALGASKEQTERIKELFLSAALVRTPEQREMLRQKVPPILTRIIQWYLDSQEDQKYVRNAAFHDVQVRLQGALAHAEDLLMEMREARGGAITRPLLDSADILVNSIEASGMVLLNVLRGKYLPKDYRFKQHDLREIIAKSISLCRPLAQQRGITFEEEVTPDNLKIMLLVSDVHLRQAFNNLIHNAVKYSFTPRNYGGRFVAVHGGYAEKGYRVTIRNYGIGIELDEYEQIFQENYKGRLQQAEYRTGSGQGLALTKRIIEAHHGRIGVQSRPVKDSSEVPCPYLTEFTVWLPPRHPAPSQTVSGK